MPSETYLFCFHVTLNGAHFGCYLIYNQRRVLHCGCARGYDQMQATSRAVKVALGKAFESRPGPIILWLRPKPSIDRLLTLKPHRDTYHVQYSSSDSTVFRQRCDHLPIPSHLPSDLAGSPHTPRSKRAHLLSGARSHQSSKP